MSTLDDFKPGDTVRVKDGLELDGGAHNGQQGTVHHLGSYFVYVSVPTKETPVPFAPAEIQHAAPLTPDDIDALPVGAVIKDSDGDTYERTSETRWTRTPDAKWGPMDRQSNWDHPTVRSLADAYSPVTLVSQPEHTPEPAPLQAKIRDLQKQVADLDAQRTLLIEQIDTLSKAAAIIGDTQ